MLPFLQQLTEYNYWANQQFIAVLQNASTTQLSSTINSSFGSVRSTAFHILDAESIWNQRLINATPLFIPSNELTDIAITELCAKWQKESLQLLNYCKYHPEEEWWSKTITYTDRRGVTQASDIWHVITHVCNHGTYHRGQLTTLLRQVGFTAIPQTDFIHYQRVLSQ
jgi:uncharacterized damage-inducible protein DinB